jgi:hypothetical protein
MYLCSSPHLAPGLLLGPTSINRPSPGTSSTTVPPPLPKFQSESARSTTLSPRTLEAALTPCRVSPFWPVTQRHRRSCSHSGRSCGVMPNLTAGPADHSGHRYEGADEWPCLMLSCLEDGKVVLIACERVEFGWGSVYSTCPSKVDIL